MYSVRQGGVLSPYLYSVHIDNLTKDLRQSRYDIFSFVGCILYADDIVLISACCHGLQKIVDICSDYVDRIGIRSNPSKSQTTVFGGRAPPCFDVKLNDANVRYHNYVDEVTYFGLFIDSRTNNVDTLQH